MNLLLALAERAVLPSNAIGVLAVMGLLALLVGLRRIGVAGLVAAALLLTVFGWLPAGRMALMVLEDRFPPPILTGPVTGIILLGGAVDVHVSLARGEAALSDAAERVTAIAALARRYPQARVLLSGGGRDRLADRAVNESSLARDVLVSLGVPPGRIELEERALDTCENATESKHAVGPDTGGQWLLVTSANHMPRAVACFRAADFPVVPYPVDYRTRGPFEIRRIPSPVSGGLAASDLAAHEWVGLIVYHLTGRTRELFPGPDLPAS